MISVNWRASTLPLLNVDPIDDSTEQQITLLLNAERHRYLAHHTLPAGPVMPGALQLEYLVEVALEYATQSAQMVEFEALTVRNFVAERWLLIDKKTTALPVSVRIDAVQHQGNDIVIDASLWSERVNKAGKRLGQRRHATARIAFHHHALQPSIATNPCDDLSPFGVDKQWLYRELMFSHGELLQSLTGQMALDRQAQTIVAGYSCGDLEKAWFSDDATGFVLSPLGVDSAMQLGCMLSLYLDQRPRFPVSFERVTRFRAHPTNAPCVLHAKLNALEQNDAWLDMVICNQAGECVMELAGVKITLASDQTFPEHLLAQVTERCEVTEVAHDL
uniref:polyketide synthase dehydratase domain-containing protein n=1 Tax=Thaumasiovibrio occultus TaxID=1891184 RepID=UPI000B361D55|nr:polyketide synthase dehydratase domain-containing protein [Thaumasiovibrio occultus]